MAKANKTRYALLGVLSYQPSSGYDIKKICDNSIGYFWNENYGHICPVLKQLESENLITKFVKETEGHPQKNIYSIT
ncbi:MAG TPA: PadR family transcriptional regulator, partial [Clostridium sp.]|nr:PadR family transcriptional regulator [Clostridium sp.]